MAARLTINGIGVMNATPLTPDDELDEREYRRHLAWLVESGVGFLVPGSPVGQGMHATEREFRRTLEIAVEVAGGRALVMAYVGRPGTAETVRLARLAKESGAHCACIVQPALNRPDALGLYEHNRAVAEAVDLPLVPFNDPHRVGVHLPLAVVERLAAEYDHFVGLRQSDPDLVSTSFFRLGERLTVWPRGEQQLLMALAMGGRGAVTVAGNLVPGELVEIVGRWASGDHDGARDLYYRLLPLMEAVMLEPVPGGVKYALGRLGWDFGPYRLPAHPVRPETAERIDRALADLGK